MANGGLDNWKTDQDPLVYRLIAHLQILREADFERLAEAVAAECERRNELAISKLANGGKDAAP